MTESYDIVRKIFFAEEGFSTIGVALALLITLALVFTTAQVYQVNTASAEIQEVADASALAAENEVAQFYVVGQLCDAVLLSLSLTSLAAFGLGLVALCVPAGRAAGVGLIDAGTKLVQARAQFYEKAVKSLNILQKALPFLSTYRAMQVAQANNTDRFSTDYAGLAVLLPGEGEELEVASSDSLEDLAGEVEGSEDEVAQKAEEAENLAKEANEAKLRAFNADCGNNPGYCMYERADSLAGLSGAANPLYTSVDAWSFEVALNRAKAYYPMRAAQEAPASGSVNEQANSALRSRFYAYACQEIQKGYVVEDDTGTFDASFPLMPKNTEEMRQTSLYTEAVYPVSNEDGEDVMHAWAGCPGITGELKGNGSVLQMERLNMKMCPVCEFKASSLGKVAAASTSIDNGFEYHYNIVAKAAAEYQEARAKYADSANAVKDKVAPLLEKVKSLMKEVSGQRIEVKPAGRYGAVAIVVNSGSMEPSAHFASSFVGDSQMLGTRVAISAATLVNDPADQEGNTLTSLLDGLREDTSGISGAGSLVLKTWGCILMGYAEGESALMDGVKEGLNSLPLVSASGLGTWASKAFSSVVEDVGLQPAELDAPKPVIVNSDHALDQDDSAFSAQLLSVKQVGSGAQGGDVFSGALSVAQEEAAKSIEEADPEATIASISLAGSGGSSVLVKIVLPALVRSMAASAASAAMEGLKGWISSLTGVRQWE